MLQFIVLGYVPGTSIQISFFDYLCGIAVCLTVTSFVWWLSTRSVRSKARRIAAIQLIAL